MAKTHMISDMSCAVPGDALSDTPRAKHWRVINYACDKAAGKLLYAGPLTDPPKIELPLGLNGWHRLTVGIWGGSYLQMGTRLKLTGDLCFRTLRREKPSNETIEAVSTDRSDQPFHTRVLPRRSIGSNDLLDSHVFYSGTEHAAVDRITVAQEGSWSLIVRKCLDDLLCRPLSGRMSSYVEVDDVPLVMTRNDEDIQHPKSDGWYGEEIRCRDLAGMVLQKRTPILRGWLRQTLHAPGDGRRSNVVSEQMEFGFNPWHAPSGILLRHTADELLNLRIEPGWGPRPDQLPFPDRLWHVEARLSDGRFIGWSPCWTTGGHTPPQVDGPRARFTMRSHPSTVATPSQGATVLTFEATPTAELSVDINGQHVRDRVRVFAEGSRVLWYRGEVVELLKQSTGIDPNELARQDPLLYHSAFKAKLHRVIPEAGFSAEFAVTDSDPLPCETNYRVRVEQRNGQRAWSSPIWAPATCPRTWSE